MNDVIPLKHVIMHLICVLLFVGYSRLDLPASPHSKCVFVENYFTIEECNELSSKQFIKTWFWVFFSPGKIGAPRRGTWCDVVRLFFELKLYAFVI